MTWFQKNWRYLLYFGVILAAVVAFFVFIVPDWFWHPVAPQVCRATYKGNALAIRDCISYNYHSGIGSDLSEVTLIVGVVIFWLKHNCYEEGCPWMGRVRSQLDGHVRCPKHHRTHREHPNYVDAKDLNANS